MSMPEITLEAIDPRIALASVVASIALQEAAVSHVLNAEGEKIQAVVNMEDIDVEDLQNINATAGGMIGSVSMLEEELQNKLRTAINALFPTAAVAIRFVDIATGLPVDCQCIQVTLTNEGTGDTSTFYAIGAALTLPSIRPGSYTLRMADACIGYELNPAVFSIDVDTRGVASFNGTVIDEDNPAEIELTAGTFIAAQGAGLEPNVMQQTAQEPGALPEDYQYGTLINNATGEAFTVYSEGGSLTLPRLAPGSYALNVIEVFEGYVRSENNYAIDVCLRGNITFNGVRVAKGNVLLADNLAIRFSRT